MFIHLLFLVSFSKGSQIEVDDAEGITADFFNVPVTVRVVTDLTLTTAVDSDFTVDKQITSDSGATARISKVDGSVLF